MFEICQLGCFIAVADELHVRRADDRPNMTQPPLSRQIRLLEHHLGARLVERSNPGVRLTAAGKAFPPEAVAIPRLVERVRRLRERLPGSAVSRQELLSTAQVDALDSSARVASRADAISFLNQTSHSLICRALPAHSIPSVPSSLSRSHP